MRIERGTWIEELVRVKPSAVRVLREKGIRCLACGEPIWGSLEEAAREKGFTDAQIDDLVGELNATDGSA